MAIYLVTGANRGIGLELAKQILQGPNNKLVAAARNSEASSLQDLQKEYGDFAQHFVTTLAPEILNTYLKQVQLYTQGQVWLSKKWNHV